MISKKIKKNLIFSCLLMNSCGFAPVQASLEEFDDALCQNLCREESSFFDDILADTKTMTFETLKSSSQTAYRFAQNAAQGDLSELSKASIHLMLAKLAGRTNVTLFSDYRNFDHKERAAGAHRLSKNLIEKMTNMLDKGCASDQDAHRFQDKKITFLYALTHRVIPPSTPLRGVFLSLAGSQTVEDFVRRRMTTMALKFVEGLAQNKNLTLNALSGEVLVTSFQKTSTASSQKILKDESVSYANKFWKSLKPYVLHKMRGHTQDLLQKSLKTCLEKMDGVLRKGAIGMGMVGGVVVGGSVMTFGAALPLVGGLFHMLGMGSTLGMVGGGAMGGFTGSSFIDALGKNTAKRMDIFCEMLASRILQYTPQEHALYALNPKESQWERDLFPQDYARRDALRKTHVHAGVDIIRALSQGNLKDVFKILSHEVDKDVHSIVDSLWKLFKKSRHIPTSTVIEQFGLDAYDENAQPHLETRAKAYRRFIALSEKNPALVNLVRQYPGYEMRVERLRYFNYVPDQKGQELLLKTRRVIQDLENISKDLTNGLEIEELGAQIFKVFLDLSVADQDLLIQMKNTDGDAFLCEALGEKIVAMSKHSLAHRDLVIILKEYLVSTNQPVVRLKVSRLEGCSVEVPSDTLHVMSMYYQELLADHPDINEELPQGQDLENATSGESSSKDTAQGMYHMTHDPNAIGLKRFGDFVKENGTGYDMLRSLDLTRLTQTLMIQKRQALMSIEDQDFFDQNRDEIYDFISAPNSPVKGRLWYGLQEVIGALRLKNDAQQGQIFVRGQ